MAYHPKVSNEPLKFPFQWQTYSEVSTRYKNLGSTIQDLFNFCDALAVNGLEMVALWSMNIPGGWHSSSVIKPYTNMQCTDAKAWGEGQAGPKATRG